MATTKADIMAWFNRGKKDGARYLIIVCDQFDWEDYPVFVHEGKEHVHERIKYYRMSPMQQIMEVYDLHGDREQQLNEYRAFNYPDEKSCKICHPELDQTDMFDDSTGRNDSTGSGEGSGSES